MAKPPIQEGSTTRTVSISMTPEEVAVVDRLAHRRHLTRSGYFRFLLTNFKEFLKERDALRDGEVS